MKPSNGNDLLTREDKVDLIRTIWIVGIAEVIAIVCSVTAIMNFMLKK